MCMFAGKSDEARAISEFQQWSSWQTKTFIWLAFTDSLKTGSN